MMGHTDAHLGRGVLSVSPFQRSRARKRTILMEIGFTTPLCQTVLQAPGMGYYGLADSDALFQDCASVDTAG